MLLAIDIGNTNINCGIFRGRRLVKRFFITTNSYQLKSIKKKIARLNIDDAVICSVVPQVTKVIAFDLQRLLGKRPLIIGKDIFVPVENLYRKPQEVGQDRLVNAYAGTRLYGAPLIVVDFGTAVTFDVISKNKEYLGGMILPGLNISLEALAERTALLPKVKLREPKEFIGRDTESSMLSGLVYGLTSLTDNMVLRIKGKIGRSAKVIITGGSGSLIKKYSRNIDKIDSNLTLKGLSFLYTPKS